MTIDHSRSQRRCQAQKSTDSFEAALIDIDNIACKALIPIAIRVRLECDSSTIRLRGVRDAYDSSTIQHPATSYEEPTRSYAHSSNNEHVNSFALLYAVASVVANQRVAGGVSAITRISLLF